MATPLDSIHPLSGLQLMVGWRRVAYESESIGVVVVAAMVVVVGSSW